MTKLTGTQLILLSTAAQRNNGSLLPLPQTLEGDRPRANKAITALVKRGHAEERQATAEAGCWRQEGDKLVGVRITRVGLAAIDSDDTQDGTAINNSPVPAPARSPTRKLTKLDLVIGLLRHEDGATIDDLVEATGWLPHTTRAALTSLRKKGHTIIRDKRGEATCYRIVQEVA